MERSFPGSSPGYPAISVNLRLVPTFVFDFFDEWCNGKVTIVYRLDAFTNQRINEKNSSVKT